ncbi:MAG TPA: hypothetical protein VFY88_07055 [Intrasporangium sp.]|nr:hypothetical protein [Intrasporangium sp.]
MSTRPHLLYLAWGFPPAAKSCVYRKLATANSFVRAGWDVTVVTLTEDAWIREQGLDRSLLDLVDPRIRVVRLPLSREDIETNIRCFSEDRALRPRAWLKNHYGENVNHFPEATFGGWRDELVASVRGIYDERPADLLLTSGMPYTFFAPALDLYDRNGLPYVLDYRDAWAIDILRDRPAFRPDSPAARFEARLIAHATEAWFVNGAIRDAYAVLYPDSAQHFHVVRNGSDVAIGTDKIPMRQPGPDEPLTFGYLGTVSFSATLTRAVCEGWRIAREANDVLRRSRLEFRGHMGVGANRGASSQAATIAEYAEYGISYGGPVAKADTAAVYEAWDALLLILPGGRYVTSGKVYDYVSTGLPIMSVHEWEHAAAEIMSDYPLWVRNDGVEAEDVAEALLQTVKVVQGATVEDRLTARGHAEQYERYAQLRPAVERLTTRFAPGLNHIEPVGDRAPKSGEDIHHEAPAPRPHAEGERVVLALTSPPSEAVRRSIGLLRDSGAHVKLIGPDSVLDNRFHDLADEVIPLQRATASVKVGPSRATKFTPKWASIVARNLGRRHILRRYLRLVGGSAGWWLSARRTPTVMTALKDATVLASLDDGATYLIWNASRMNRRAPALAGIGATLEELGLTRV